MSFPINNKSNGGYAPPAFVAGYPNAPPAESGGGGGYAPTHAMGFQQQQQSGVNAPSGYSPGEQSPNAIITQPGAAGPGGDGKSVPAGIPNCPRGLEYLTTIDQLLVAQKVERLEVFTGFETNNKFSIKNSLGQTVYFAAEDSDCCTRNICGSSRPFDMIILDNFKKEVIHLNRPLACSACCFPCCLQSIEVSAPPGNVIGSIEQEWSICSPSFKIKNQSGETVLRIEGPFCTFSLCGDVEFQVVSLDGRQVGKISKQWSGFAKEMFTDADVFGVTFPMDLDVRMKATLLGATFLIDAMFFEKS